MSIDRRPEADPAETAAKPHVQSGEFDVIMDMNALKRASITGSAATAVAQVVKMISQFGSQIILARLLFPEDFGLVAMIFPVLALIQIFGDLGFAQAIIQRPTLTQPQVSSLFWINLAIGMALGCIIAAIAPIAALMYSEPRLTAPMQALAIMLPIATLGVHPAALLTRRMRFGVLAISEVAAALSGIAASIGCALQGWSYWSLVAGSLVSVLVNMALNWSRCNWRPSFPSLAPSLRSDLKFGGGITVSNLSNFVTTSGDAIIIGVTLGKTALGLFDRSYRLVVQPINQLIAPIGRVALPLLCRLADRPEGYRRTFLDLFQGLFLMTAPIMLICSSNAAVLVNWLLGPRWSEASPIFAWICVGGLTAGVFQSAIWLFVSQARTGELARHLLAAAVINLTSYLLGAIGGIIWIAALGSISFTLLTTPLVLRGATRVGPVTARHLVEVTTPIVVQSLLAYAALKLQLTMGIMGLPQLVLATLTCCAVFGVTGYFVERQRELARRLFRQTISWFKPWIASRRQLDG